MNPYELLYDAAGKGYVRLDLDAERPAMTYQINTLNELKDRQAAYSQAIRLPKTPHNLRTLGFIDAFDVAALAAYEPRGCCLLCEGALLTPFQALLIVDSVDEHRGGSIHCQIVSDVYDLFTRLSDADTERMGSTLFANVWTSEAMRADNAGEGPRKWPLLFTEKGVRKAVASVLKPDIQRVEVHHMVPCYHLNTMLRELLERYDYRLESDLSTDPFADRLYLTASKMYGKGDQSGRIRTLFRQERFQLPDVQVWTDKLIVHSGGIAPVPEQRTNAGVIVTRQNPDIPNYGTLIKSMRFYAEEPGTYRVDISVANTGNYDVDDARRLEYAIIVCRAGDERVVSGNRLRLKARASATIPVEDQQLGLGDYIELQFDRFSKPAANTNFTFLDFKADISIVTTEAEPFEPSPTEACGVGMWFDHLQSSGFKNCNEFVKSYLQLFGAMIDIERMAPVLDEQHEKIWKGKVRIYTYEELYRRRDAGRYADWSDKLVTSADRSFGFAVPGYAQRNVIALTENADDGTADRATIRCGNRSLEPEKSLFTLAVEAGRDITYTNVARTVGVVPTLEREVETDDNGRERVTLRYAGCGPHIVSMTGEKVSCRDLTGAYAYGGSPRMDVPSAVCARMSDFTERYYKRIEGMLDKARTISVQVLLTPCDIEHLDFFTPVYIERYGAYFYLSKISNFTAGRPTKVELVRL